MSSLTFNKHAGVKKLYSEAYRYQELGAFLLHHLQPPNGMDGTLAKAGKRITYQELTA